MKNEISDAYRRVIDPKLAPAVSFARGARSKVVDDGVLDNTHSRYDSEVGFENIVPTVNITRVKVDDAEVVGVAKGPLLTGVPITVTTNSAGATMHAMKKRSDFAPNKTEVANFVRGHNLLMGKFDAFPTFEVTRESFEAYLSNCAPGKAVRLAAALASDELTFDGYSKHVFAKQETLLKQHGVQPRLVYQGTDMYNAVTAVVATQLAKNMHLAFSKTNPKNAGNKVVFACGMSGEELGEVIDHAPGDVIESDMKNNDASQSGAWRKYEAMFYKKLGAPDWFVREFARNTSIRVWTRYGVAAPIEGQRWSGESTTTTGNSYVSMSLILASLDEAGVRESTNIHGGDDYLGFSVDPRNELPAAIEKVVAAAGMKAEVFRPKTVDHATFYRKRYPYCQEIGSRLPVPQFGRVLAKLNLRPNKNSEVNDRDYMAGKYASAAYESRHVPVIRDILQQTAIELSQTPYFDSDNILARRSIGADVARAAVANAVAFSQDEVSSYCEVVYGQNFQDVVDVYSRMAQGCKDFCDGWVLVGDAKNPARNKRDNHRYRPCMLHGDVIDSLVKHDT